MNLHSGKRPAGAAINRLELAEPFPMRFQLASVRRTNSTPVSVTSHVKLDAERRTRMFGPLPNTARTFLRS